jgi:uncharacterized protein (TIGR02118 family)
VTCGVRDFRADVATSRVHGVGAAERAGQTECAPGAPATDAGMCHIYPDCVESLQKAHGANAKAIMADIPRYTDLVPVLQMSEVSVG